MQLPSTSVRHTCSGEGPRTHPGGSASFTGDPEGDPGPVQSSPGDGHWEVLEGVLGGETSVGSVAGLFTHVSRWLFCSVRPALVPEAGHREKKWLIVCAPGFHCLSEERQERVLPSP